MKGRINMRILAVGAHLDDIEIACGGTLAKAIENGHDVKVLIMSKSGYTNKDGGNYISYKRVDGAKEGDKILTYYIYNPFTNEQDDVLTRMDFIIDDNAI